MNTKLFQEWLIALRSDQYEQGSGRLRRGDTYCCLGVLCDIVDPEGWKAGIDEGMEATTRPYGDAGATQFLPYEVLELIGLADQEPMVTIDEEFSDRAVAVGLKYYPGSTVGVATLNDDGVPFSQIARLLEKEYLL